MNLFDTHCHLFDEYYSDISSILNESIQAGVTQFILSGCSKKSNLEVINKISVYENMFGVIGLHPEEASFYKLNDIKEIEANLSQKNIIGIGEIGLDYHYTVENKEKQKELFHSQLKLAQKYDLPVVIHSRDATEDTINILKEYSIKGIIHSFSGSLETAKIYIKMGFYLGINGVITFKNCKLKDILPEIFEYIVLETDSPYLTPHPFRGQQNSPKHIMEIADFIAKELNISVSQVEKLTNENIRRVFDI